MLLLLDAVPLPARAQGRRVRPAGAGLPRRGDLTARTAGIVGAGIAGLTAALALARRGWRVEVFEAAAELQPVGAGIQLSPNAVRCLDGLGLLPVLRDHWSEPEAIRVRRGRDGHTIVRMDLRAAARRWGAPYAVLARGDLQAVLLEAVRRDRAVTLHLGTRIGATGPEGRQGYDLTIGADGVWSASRIGMPGAMAARFMGRRAFRAVVPADAVPAAMLAPDLLRRETGLWLGPGAHLVHYPVRSGKAVNLVAVVPDQDAGRSWSEPADATWLLARFAGWSESVRSLLAAVPDWRGWPLVEGAVPDSLARGQLVLVGDAAHPVLPFLAQGGALAIEDATVLAARLDGPGSLEDALQAYSRERVGRARRVQAEARTNGTRYHWAGAMARARDLGLGLLGGERLLARYDWLYGWRPPA